MFRLIYTSLILLFALQGIVNAQTMLHLKDGSRILGKIAEETEELVTIETRYGTLNIPALEIQKREARKENIVIEEEWTITGADQPATLTRTIFFKDRQTPTLTFPIEGTVTTVTNAEGKALDWVQEGSGPVALLTVQLAGEKTAIRVTSSVEAPLKKCDDNCLTFSRVYTPSNGGNLSVKITIPENWKVTTQDIDTEKSSLTIERPVRRQELVELSIQLSNSE